ncbi:MAG: prolipoprotein diacylglyceryl transferase family protein [Planctomycetota bacterium]
MIRIGIDPMIFQAGAFGVSWHGVFMFVGVAAAVVLVAWWARREHIDPDVVYSVAVWAVISGIVGAKIVHVIDYWDFYSQNPMQIFSRSGIAIYGALLFGFLGGAAYIQGRQLLGRIYSAERSSWLKSLVGQRIAQGYLKGTMYAKFKDLSIGHLADVTAPALLIAQTIGRIGCAMIGDHPSTRTDLPWGFVYSHPDSLSNQKWGLLPSHPVIAYEMIWSMVVLAIIWKLRGRLAPPGMLFALYLMLYSLGRFFIQFLRFDKVWFAGLSEAHIIALIVMAVTVPLLAYKTRWVQRQAPSTASQRQSRG